jgi:hypothetical protein
MAYSGYEQIENAIFGKNCHDKKFRKAALSKIQTNHRLPGPVLTQRALDHIEARDQEVKDCASFWRSIRTNAIASITGCWAGPRTHRSAGASSCPSPCTTAGRAQQPDEHPIHE